ncbi:hypothetical protein HK102_003761 [Quaeritorhiza haematococci]|nr:hypothetical protein HK102_003761 [Quaeritorhiza haematococci]
MASTAAADSATSPATTTTTTTAASPMSAWIIGGSGLVGRKVIRELLASNKFSKVTVIGRRALRDDEQHDFVNKDKLVQVQVNFDKLDEHKDAFGGHDVGFACLGTTRADAGSAEAFYRIDHDYVLNSCKLYQQMSGASSSSPKSTHVLLVTATGSNSKSMLLYPRTKGEIEEHCADIGLTKLSIFRPGFLIPDPNEARPRRRLLEDIAGKALDLIGNPKSMAVKTSDVAKSMRIIAEKGVGPPKEGEKTIVEAYGNEDIIRFATGL